MINIEDLDFIDRSLKGDLSPQEQEEFEARRKKNKDFENAFLFSKDLVVSLKQAERIELKKKLQKISAKYVDEGEDGYDESIETPQIKSLWNNYLSIAASVAFLLVSAGIGYFISYNESKQELASYQLQLQKLNNEIASIQNEIELNETIKDSNSFGFIESDSSRAGFGPSEIEKLEIIKGKNDSIRAAIEIEKRKGRPANLATIIFYFVGVIFLVLVSVILFLGYKIKKNNSVIMFLINKINILEKRESPKNKDDLSKD